VIQKRLGRRKVTDALLRDAPVVFFAFDILFCDGDVLFEVPLRERLRLLRDIAHGEVIRASDQTAIRDAAHVDTLFDDARERANEGLVVKAPDSIYTPGRRGKSWLKYKKGCADVQYQLQRVVATACAAASLFDWIPPAQPGATLF